MAEYFVYFALDEQRDRWEPGALLGAFPVNHVFNPCDFGSFHWERISTEMSLDEVKAMRTLKCVDLNKLLTAKGLQAKLAQKQNIADRHLVNGEKIAMGDLTVKPQLDTAKTIAQLQLKNATKIYETSRIVPPMERDIEIVEESKGR